MCSHSCVCPGLVARSGGVVLQILSEITQGLLPAPSGSCHMPAGGPGKLPPGLLGKDVYREKSSSWRVGSLGLIQEELLMDTAGAHSRLL